jgi:hypothetical protein
MGKILLDAFFPITTIDPTPEASTAFLKQVCIVCLPKAGQEANVGEIFECTTNAQVAVRTDNTEAAQLFNAGMATVNVLLADDLYLDEFLEGKESDFFTLLISSDFDKDDINATKATGVITISSYANLVSGTDDAITVGGTAFTAQAGAATLGEATFQAATSNDATAASLAAQINAHAVASTKVVATVLNAVVTLTAVADYSPGNDVTLTYTDNDTNVGAVLSGLSGGALSGGDGLSVGDFSGVIGVSSTDDSFLATQAAISNRAAFHTTSGNKAKNMFYAFGKLLSNALNWLNQQYIEMPFADDIDTLGETNNLFDDRISHVISDDEFGERLGLFCAGGKAITAPYIKKNLEIDMQSAALTYVSGNQPPYTQKHAALLQDELQKVINGYIDDQEIEAGVAAVTIDPDSNFTAEAEINISEPKALWRIVGQMQQTL